jgi:hypothetical protein
VISSTTAWWNVAGYHVSGAEDTTSGPIYRDSRFGTSVSKKATI